MDNYLEREMQRQDDHDREQEHRQKQLYADERAQHWLFKYNIAIEEGNQHLADVCYSKAHYWLDRLNQLEGLS